MAVVGHTSIVILSEAKDLAPAPPNVVGAGVRSFAGAQDDRIVQ